MDTSRRRLIATGIACAAASQFLTTGSRAQDDDLFTIVGDDGQPVPNFKLPSEPSLAGLRGVVWEGPESADVILIEFFDYNCPFCRKASGDLEALVVKDTALRLGLVNNAILSLGSVLSARVQQAVLKLYGPAKARAYHVKMLARRGINDGAVALQTAKELGLDVKKVEAAANGDDVLSVLNLQRQTAADLGLVATPSFALNGVAVLGYPGPRTTAQMIFAARACDRPAC
jgi:protein-disulfide isomerase